MARVCVYLLVLVVAAYCAQPESKKEELNVVVYPNGQVYDSKTGELLSAVQRDVEDEDVDEVSKRFLWRRRRRRQPQPRPQPRPQRRGQLTVGANQNGLGGSYDWTGRRSKGSINAGIDPTGQYRVGGGINWGGRGGASHGLRGHYSNGPNGPNWGVGYTLRFKKKKRDINEYQQKKLDILKAALSNN